MNGSMKGAQTDGIATLVVRGMSKSCLAVDREFMYIGSAGQADGGKAGRTGGWVGGKVASLAGHNMQQIKKN